MKDTSYCVCSHVKTCSGFLVFVPDYFEKLRFHLGIGAMKTAF